MSLCAGCFSARYLCPEIQHSQARAPFRPVFRSPSGRSNSCKSARHSATCRRSLKVLSSAEASTSGPPKFSETATQPVRASDGTVNSFPALPGVYGVFNPAGELQYIGLSRNVSTVAHRLNRLGRNLRKVKAWRSEQALNIIILGLFAGLRHVGELLQ